MARKTKDFSTIYDSLMTVPEEALSPEEVQATRAEAGEVSPPESAPSDEAKAEETPEAKADVEVKAESEAKTEPEKKEKKLTPAQERIQELVRERNDYEAKLREQNEKWARLEERQRLIQEAAFRQQQEEQARQVAAADAARRANERPDPTIDPVGAKLFDLEEQNRTIAAQLEAKENEFKQAFAQRQVQNDVQQFSNALQQDIQGYRARTPDYDEAAKYATDARFNYWKNIGIDDAEAARRVQAEALAIAKDALDHGKSPAEIYYNTAKQWGWTPQAATARGATTDANARLRQIEAGTKVQGFGGRTPNVSESETVDLDTLSPAQLASMSEEAFLSLLKDPRSARALQQRIQSMELS